ncbi:MAG: MFS transporter [Mediterranea sp.]|nr:MFS transporter [Mediterranea sp.]
MKKRHSITALMPVLFGFFIMGFCDIVGISSDYVQRAFQWSSGMTGFVPSLVFIWFLFLGIPVGNRMNRWGRKNTVLLSMGITVVGMLLPLLAYNSATCMAAYALLGIGNAILQVSLNPLLSNVVTNQRLLTSSLTAGQVIKAVSSLLGPEIVMLAVSHYGEEHWYYCFPILGGITLLSALWLVLSPIRREEASNPSQAISIGDTFGLLKDRTILLLFLGIFFIVGVDVATNFISSKLMAARFGWTEAEVKFAPQVYFLSRTVGALLGAFLLTRLSSIKYFQVNILACIASLLALAFVENSIANLACIGGVGFFASSVFSIIYAMALQAKPRKANQISGLMITAVAGGGVVTPVLGFAIGAIGIVGGVYVVLACVLYLTYCAFGVRLE